MKHAIEIQIGQRLRKRRILLGLNQRALGSAIGVKLQQIQKYENGLNSLRSTHLYRLARVLRVPIGYFFERTEAEDVPSPLETLGNVTDRNRAASERECLEFIKAFRRIKNRPVRTKISRVARAIADRRQDSRS